MLRTWNDNTLRMISEIQQVFELKIVDDYEVQILTDPWSKEAAIWKLKIDLEKLSKQILITKLRDFEELRNQPYTENINW